MKLPLVLLITCCFATVAFACLWDADTLQDEKKKSPKLAEVVLGTAKPEIDIKGLETRIEQLSAGRREDDPAWWNDLAGAHIRLGEPQKAVDLLQPLVARFPDDYGVHANLGTAYHLLGNYVEAEKYIARDLELNPNGHFGLEKYHLALLQYLIRDAAYQSYHLYVYEWTESFRRGPPEHLYYRPFEPDPNDPQASAEPPGYTKQFNLAEDPKFEEGVLYMASLNPRQPACFTMLGVACLKRRDLNLAVAAFEKAIALGSPQTELLNRTISELKEHIEKAKSNSFSLVRTVPIIVLGGIAGLVVFRLCKRFLRRSV